MRTYRQRRSLIGRISIIGLLLSLWPQQMLSAQPIVVTCADGYVLWANRQLTNEVFQISGSNNTLTGAIHSNADLRISGSNNQVLGSVKYVAQFEDAGDDNSYTTPVPAVVSPPPVSYTLADYQPGGVIATTAQAAGRYTLINGDLDVAEPEVLDGLYYVTGNAKLSASGLSGTFTIVAEGMIDVSGSSQQIQPYADGLLLFSNKRAAGAAVIKLAGSNSTLAGVIIAPGGQIEAAGSNNSITGLIVGDALKLSGSTLAISFTAEHCPGASDQPDPTEYTPDEVVVKLFNAADLTAVALAYGLNATPLDQFGTRPIFRLQITDGTDPYLKAEQLRPADGSGGDGRVEYAEPNYLTQTPEARRGRTSWVVGDDVGGYTQQWAPAMIGLSSAHTVSQGAGVTVAILDTGIDTTHPALASRITGGFDFVDFDNDPSEEGAYGLNPGYGHGTHVAGLVALVAPAATIMPVRVLDRDGAGNIWVLSEGLLFAAQIGPDGQPASDDEAQVINLSLGTLRRTQLLEDLISELTCSDDDDDDDDDDAYCSATGGVVVVAAAGNNGNTMPHYPAAETVAGSIAIGASTPIDTLAGFSTRGAWVPLVAPGESITSTVPGGGYGSWSGTSMAAPLTAGAAALIRAAKPDLKAVEITTRLIDTAAQIDGPITKRLDVAAALGIPSSGGSSRAFRAFLPALSA